MYFKGLASYSVKNETYLYNFFPIEIKSIKNVQETPKRKSFHSTILIKI